MLGKDVAEVVSRCHTNQQEDTRFHLTSDEMETDVDVLAPVVVDLVARKLACSTVVVEQRGRTQHLNELRQKRHHIQNS